MGAGAFFRSAAGISREEEAQLFSVLCQFLNEHGLAASPLPEKPESWDGFELRYSNLTEDGAVVMSKGLTRWLAAIDRGTPPGCSPILLRELKKVRGTLQ
jgi:hypothetical protein